MPPTTPTCPGNTFAWRRGENETVCSIPCTRDSECQAGARCRILDFSRGPTAPVLLAEDHPELLESDDTESTRVALCDPRWDRPGVALAEAAP